VSGVNIYIIIVILVEIIPVTTTITQRYTLKITLLLLFNIKSNILYYILEINLVLGYKEDYLVNSFIRFIIINNNN
ncbi:hypothetical protein OFC03_26890, partial [Escherichia coli]|nr:hypothetical protein [Escherichia coli]